MTTDELIKYIYETPLEETEFEDKQQKVDRAFILLSKYGESAQQTLEQKFGDKIIFENIAPKKALEISMKLEAYRNNNTVKEEQATPVSIQELLKPLFPQGTDFNRVKLLRHPDKAWESDGDDSYEEYQKRQSKDVFKDIDYVVSTIGVLNNGNAALFKGVYSVKYRNHEDWLNPVSGETFPMFFYDMNKLDGFGQYEDKVQVEFTGAIKWNQLWNNEKLIISGLDVEQYKIERLSSVLTEFVGFSDWSYAENNGEYSPEKVSHNIYIIGRDKADTNSDITIAGTKFGWNFNKAFGGKNLWNKGYINHRGNNIVYDRSDENNKKLVVEIYQGNGRGDGTKNEVNSIQIGAGTVSEQNIIESVTSFWDFLNKEEAKKETASSTGLVNDTVSKLIRSKNIILRGAPGTGKSYLAKEVASQIIGVDKKELKNSSQFEFIQFHPSYDYTDFVEGLRPENSTEGTMGFELQDGVFKKFITKAKKSQNTGVDNFDEIWDNLVTKLDDNNFIDIPNSHRGSFQIELNELGTGLATRTYPGDYGVGDWIQGKGKSRFYNKEQLYNIYRGLPGVPAGGHDNYRKAIVQYMKDNLRLKDYVLSESISSKPFVFVIDEINRGEISKILGELFFSIDPSYRGEDGAVQTQYSNLHENDEKFYIPDNVYIIGTMNDIDRSVDSFDFAMRRRFRFIEIKAEETTTMWQCQLKDEEIENATNRLIALNEQITATDDLNSNYHIGPSYFLKLPELDYNYEVLWEDYLKPLLEEYLRGSYEEEDKLDAMKAAYDLKADEVTADED